MSLKVFGLEAFGKAVARGISLAERAEEMLRESPCWWDGHPWNHPEAWAFWQSWYNASRHTAYPRI